MTAQELSGDGSIIIGALPVRLTAREVEVLSWVAQGKTAADIGEILAISSHTVMEHLKNIRRKLASSNNTQSVFRAVQIGALRL